MKKLFCFALTLLLLIPRTAYAKDALEVHMEGYQSQVNSITVNLNTNSEQKLSASQLKLTLGGNELPIQDVTSVEKAEQGITYLLLVDVSGSIKNNENTEMKKILEGIAGQLGDNDNAAIMLVGNDYITGDFIQGKEKLLEQIEAIKSSSQDTNLYAAIVNAIGILNTNQQAQTKKCLVILSDGKDDFTTGYTKDEVEAKIKEANMPIYTVALLKKDASDTLIEAAKVLGSFARQSDGGLDITYGLEDVSAKDVSKEILQSLKSGYIVTADTTSLKLTGEQSYLEITLNTDKEESATDGYNIDASELQIQPSPVSPTVEPTVEPTVKPEKEAPVTAKEGKSNFILIIIIVISVIALLSIVLTILLWKRKKRKNNKPEADVEWNSDVKPENGMEQSENVSGFKKSRVQRTLYFTKVGLVEEQTYTVKMDDELTIGRNSAMAQLVFDKDELLSSKHCKITDKSNQLYIEDMNSTNGTYVNGVPIKQPHHLENDDIILIGSMELRIHW